MINLNEKYSAIKQKTNIFIEKGIPVLRLELSDVTNPTRAKCNGKDILLAGTNNYMGCTFDEECIKAGYEALHNYGTGTTGSRAANGGYDLHTQLEKNLAHYLKRKYCSIFTTGYQANLAVISTYVTKGDKVFVDIDSHASIYDGCRLSGAEIIVFKHNDAQDLAKRLERNKDAPGGKLVILEGLYSMFGDRAPLHDFVDLKQKYDFTLLLDEAHSFGIIGENGRGLAEEQGVEEHIDLIVGTFSKSLGSIGGFAASNSEDFNLLPYIARPYIFSASQCPSSIATTIEALKQFERKPERRKRSKMLSEKLHAGLKALGLNIACDVPSPIVAVKIADENELVKKWNDLLENGLYVNIALPPGTPSGTYLLRCSVSSAHQESDIEQIISIFQKCVV